MSLKSVSSAETPPLEIVIQLALGGGGRAWTPVFYKGSPGSSMVQPGLKCQQH